MDQSERRVIAHMDADAFFASVHLLENPELKGKPVVVAGNGARSIVTTASYEARKYGIHSAQSAAEARRRCPHATFITPEFDLYRSYSKRAMDHIEKVTNIVEPVSLDEAYLDITKIEKPIRTMRQLVAGIEEDTGLKYSVGIGPNKLCAKVLSDLNKPAAFNVGSIEQCCEWFAHRSPKLIPGIGPKTLKTLDLLGIKTIANLREFSQAQLEKHFGERRAKELYTHASFIHSGEVQAQRERKSLSEEITFDTDISDIEELKVIFSEMSDDLCVKLNQRSIAGRTITIKVRLDDFTTATRSRTLQERTNDPMIVAEVARALFEEYAPARPVRLIGVGVSKFSDPPITVGKQRNMYNQLQLFSTR